MLAVTYAFSLLRPLTRLTGEKKSVARVVENMKVDNVYECSCIDVFAHSTHVSLSDGLNIID